MMFRTVLAVIAALVLCGSSVFAQTPSVGSASITTSDTAYQILWGEGAELLDDGSGSGAIWRPISLRLFLTDSDMNIAAELVNTSDVPMTAPNLSLVLSSDGQSLGTEEFSSENEWVPAGGSAFYQHLNVFGGSLFIEDWDDYAITLAQSPFRSPDFAAYDSLEINGERLTNNGEVAIGEVYFIEVERDAEGIFTASCMGVWTGANILPGKSVRAPGLGDVGNPGGCGFAFNGEPASESLGIGGPYTAEHVISSIQDPT